MAQAPIAIRDRAVPAELAQHVHVLGVAQAAFDDADVAFADLLDVGQRRTVEFDQLEQVEQPLVDIEEGHVAAEAAGERGRGDLEFPVHGGIHCCSFASAAVAST